MAFNCLPLLELTYVFGAGSLREGGYEVSTHVVAGKNHATMVSCLGMGMEERGQDTVSPPLLRELGVALRAQTTTAAAAQA